MYYTQNNYVIRCEWGEEGVRRLGPECDVLVIVDVLSFSTCVDVAVGRGALVYPFRFRDETAEEYARSLGAVLALKGREAGEGYSLSPASLRHIREGTKLVLPSPNGATLSWAGKELGATVYAGCLRNAEAVARAASGVGQRIGVIAAGERWPDGTLRPAAEDQVGAGAIIHHLSGEKSPEARLAESAYLAVRGEIGEFLRGCVSGRELIERDFAEDVEIAAALGSSAAAPVLVEGAYMR
jgi:2-phosphosulfolactate phosphatase